jgi:hypothetical protein
MERVARSSRPSFSVILSLRRISDFPWAEVVRSIPLSAVLALSPDFST